MGTSCFVILNEVKNLKLQTFHFVQDDNKSFRVTTKGFYKVVKFERRLTMSRKVCISLLRVLTIYLAFAILVISSIPSQSSAMFISPSPGAGSLSIDSAVDISKIRTFLESKIVQQRLADFGLTGEEISSRLGQLSPDQLHRIATHIDQLDSGGDSALGVLISLLVIVILIIVVLKLMNRQIIIK